MTIERLIQLRAHVQRGNTVTNDMAVELLEEIDHLLTAKDSLIAVLKRLSSLVDEFERTPSKPAPA